MKKILSTILALSLSSSMLCTTASAVTMYAPDGRTAKVAEADVKAWKAVGWYENNYIIMYAPDGRTEKVLLPDIGAWKKVGWYEVPVTKVYAPDGRKEIVAKSEVDAWLKVGWYKSKTIKMYSSDGRTKEVPISEVAYRKSVGWSETPVTAKIPTPKLKYKNAGTLGLWTEESYYSSPVACDLDGDGKKEIVFSNYSITVLNAKDGSVKWKVNSGYDRTSSFKDSGKSVGHTWCDVVVEDIDGDGKREVITGHGNGLISVLDRNGYFKKGWPQTPTSGSVRSLKVEDLDGDGKKEIVVGYGKPSHKSVYVLNYDGTLRKGWPKLTDDQQRTEGWSYGVFMNGIAITDMDNNGNKEIIVPTDTSFISAYKHDGRPVKANSTVYGDRNWGHIALYEDYNEEIKGRNGGWGRAIVGGESRAELYKAEFGHGMTTVNDLDGDGKKEIIVSGIMCNRKHITYPPSEYMTIAILNADRTRYKNDKLNADWTKLPVDLGKPLIQNSVSISSFVCQTPVVSDLNGDGKKEILFNSYNGKVHCFSLDKTEQYEWPYKVTKSGALFEYASPVVCVDLNNDGKKEVIFTSYYDKYQTLSNIVQGSLYILDYKGRLVSKTKLPAATEANNKHNGAMSMPVVKDIDGDGKYEIVINTLHGAICVYDL